MANRYTRGDSLYEYLTGAGSDGGAQTDPTLSLGGFRSSTEALSLGIALFTPIAGVAVLYAGGANPVGNGILTALDGTHLTWQPAGATSPGPPCTFSGVADVEIVEAADAPGQYLRIAGTTPFAPGTMTVALSYLADNFFGFDDLSIAQAAAGTNEYRATIVRNESPGEIGAFQRWIASLGLPQQTNGGGLPASGSGTITTLGSFSTWPTAGWANVQTSGGALREVVYYSARTGTQLIVPATGRALLGTTSSAGTGADTVYSVPGVALAEDPTHIQAFGSSIQVIANAQTSPAGVTWNLGINAAQGLNIGTMGVGTQVGIWAWRQTPPNLVSTPQALVKFADNFNAF